MKRKTFFHFFAIQLIFLDRGNEYKMCVLNKFILLCNMHKFVGFANRITRRIPINVLLKIQKKREWGEGAECKSFFSTSLIYSFEKLFTL